MQQSGTPAGWDVLRVGDANDLDHIEQAGKGDFMQDEPWQDWPARHGLHRQS